MTSFLLRFEAIESRVASYSVPHGTNGRLHTLRLRRYFSYSGRCQQDAAVATRQSFPTAPSQQQSIANTIIDNGRNAKRNPGLQDVGSQLELGLEMHNGEEAEDDGVFRYKETNSAYKTRLRNYRRLWGWKMLPGGRATLPNVGHQDILPYHFPDGVQVECSPDETALYQALRVGNPHDLLKAVISLIRFDGFDYYSRVLHTIPASTFSEILRCLDPQIFVGRFAQLHTEISPNYGKVIGVPLVNTSGNHPFFTLFLSQIHGIMKARQRDHPLSLSDHKYLLKCAKLTANTKVAKEVWMGMTAISTSGPDESVTPDGECYKLYLATMTWSDPRNPLVKSRLRVIPDNFNPRSWYKPPYSLKGHRVGPDNGIKLHVSQIFHQMVRAGVPGDEETFCLMIVAFAREGDLTSVGSTLRRVWGVDVDAIMGMTDDSELQAVKQYSYDSPFYPTEKLLLTISHAYGINNALPTALRVVDFVSRQYNVPIPIGVWNELLQWTHILSVKRYGARVEGDGTNIGGLPQAAVSNIWATMQSEPYNVRPTMEMYDKYISNLVRRQRYGEMQEVMQEARTVHVNVVRRLSRMHILLKTTLQGGHPLSEKRMRDMQFLKLVVTRNREYIKRWVRLLIKTGSLSLRHNSEFCARELPNILRRWKLFIPQRVDYPVATGRVRFWTDQVVDRGIQQRKWRVGYAARQKRHKRYVKRQFKERDEKGQIRGWEGWRGCGMSAGRGE